MKEQDILLLEQERPLSVDPKKFLTWLFIVSIVMMFAAWTSAYIVRRAEGNWLDIELPSGMYITTAIIFFSSISLHIGYLAAKKDNFKVLNLGILVTVVLAIAFLIGQFFSWGQLVENNVYFAGKYSNPAGSFLYVLMGMHGFHVITGLIFLLIVLFKSFKLKIHSKSLTLMEMCLTYWHFLGGLWIYLFVFLLYNR
ncbi:MAG: heme-copper oxidase subunit III [Cytophagaceae bacterium]